MEQEVRLRIFATDPQRARAFYAQVFGWSLPEHGWHCWMITTSDDPRLGIDGPHPTGTDHPVSAGKLFIPTVHVTDLDATTTAAHAAGGDVLVPRIPVPGVGWLIYLADTEGNLIGVMQDDLCAAWPSAPNQQAPAGAGPAGRPGGGGGTRRGRHHSTAEGPREGW